MLKLSCAVLAGVALAALCGCSSSASDPAVANQSNPAPPSASAPAQTQAGSTGASASGVLPVVPPTLAPVGPIPGPRMAGENPATAIENPYAGNPSALQEGRQLFVEMNCAGCHGGHAGGGMGPTLRSPKEWLFGNTPADIFDSISDGRGEGMPAWGTKLPPDVIWKLVAYIQSLGTAEEPDKAAAAPARAPNSVATPSY